MKPILFAVLAVSAFARPIVHWETARVVSQEFQLIGNIASKSGKPIHIERVFNVVELEDEAGIHYRLVETGAAHYLLVDEGKAQLYFRDAKGFVLPDAKGRDHRFTPFTWKTR